VAPRNDYKRPATLLDYLIASSAPPSVTRLLARAAARRRLAPPAAQRLKRWGVPPVPEHLVVPNAA
jgi:hypothetical protein